VMVAEVVEAFEPVPEGPVLDATVGGGGHAEALLEGVPQISLVGLDRDADAIAAAQGRLERFGERAQLVHARFGRLGEVAAALGATAPHGRVAVLAYHSGEDRLVKTRFRHAVSGGCTCPPRLPCVCGARGRARLLTQGARRPSSDEVAANPRAEAARMRALEL